MIRAVITTICLLVITVTAADEAAPVITADNVARLESVAQVDFDGLPLDVPVDSGWFILNASGERAAVVRRDGGLVVFDTETGAHVDTYTISGTDGDASTVLHAAYPPAGREIAALHGSSSGYVISIYAPGDSTQTIPLDVAQDQPVRIWWAESKDAVWIETLPYTGDAYVRRIPLPGLDLTPVQRRSAPQASDAVARNGRTRAPQAVTAGADGRVRLWNLETGSVIGSVQMPHTPRFSRVNDGNGGLLALRDPVESRLYLANFDTSGVSPLAPLDDTVHALIVGQQGDVVLGAGFGDASRVGAWTLDGRFHPLGDYRTCSRPPDMARLSSDGRTLVIGCDTGLDVWRVESGEGVADDSGSG